MNHVIVTTIGIIVSVCYIGDGRPAHAGIIYQTGFESPTFTVGPLAGQDGWNVFSGGGTPNAVTVETAVADSGSQAVEVNTVLASGQTGPYRYDPTSPSDTIVTMQADVMLTSSSVQTSWQFAGITPALQFMGGFNVLSDGTLQIITSGFPATAPVIARDVWNEWQVVYNFGSQSFDIFVNDSLVAADEPFLTTSSTFGEGLFDTFNAAGGNDKGYLDNYSITSVPEPGSLVLLGSSMLLLLGVARRSRQELSASQ